MTDSEDLSPEDIDEPRPRRRRRWPWIVLLSVVVVPALLLGLWTAITMSYTYSSGYRTGYIQKLSKKGWLCKTWEGELAMVNVPGALQERFEFTVRSDSVAAAINDLQGQRVKLHYREHRGVPLSCLGETAYFVDGVESVEGPYGPEQLPRSGGGDSATPAAPRRDTIDPSPGRP